MSYTNWNTDPNLNITVNGINIDENCPPQNLNNAVRSVMSGVAELANNIPSTTGLAPKDGAVFEGSQPRFSGGGALLSHADNGNASGKVYLLAEGASNPASPNQGDIVLFYTP